MMRDDRIHVEAALQHARHLVPGLEHLASIDAFQDQAFEDHVVPVDRHIPWRNAEDGDLAAMMHRAQHVAKSLRIS